MATDTSLLTDGVGLMCGSGDWLLLTTVLGVVVAESLSGVNTSSPFSCRNTKTYENKRVAYPQVLSANFLIFFKG